MMCYALFRWFTMFLNFLRRGSHESVVWKLYTYRAGTSTATAVYTDAACTTAAANPVVLDSAGEATIYLKGKYKFTLWKYPLRGLTKPIPIWSLDDVQDVQGMGIPIKTLWHRRRNDVQIDTG